MRRCACTTTGPVAHAHHLPPHGSRLSPTHTRPRSRSRLAQTKPVVDYYSKQGLYSPIDANQKFDTVKAAISAILSK